MVCYKNKSYEFEKVTFPHNYKILLMIPGYKVDTLEARRLIPSEFLLDDCMYNISHFALLINSLREGDLEKAIIFIRDRLHQAYRKKLFPRSMELVYELNER